MSLATSPVLAALREATHATHRTLEGTLHIAAPDAGPPQYRAYLEALWGWLAPFEAALWSAPWPPSLRPALRDGKRGWIEEDLRALGLSEEGLRALPSCAAPQLLTSAPQRFGVAYVVEGAQLGGQVLLRRLGPALGPRVPRYLFGYGAETSALWRAYTESLEASVAPSSAPIVAAAALQTFDGLRDWLGARGVAGGAA